MNRFVTFPTVATLARAWAHRLATVATTIILLLASTLTAAEPTKVRPADTPIRIDGLSSDWDALAEGDLSAKNDAGAELRISHDRSWLLLLARGEDSSQHTLAAGDRMEIELHWQQRGSGPNNDTWSCGLNENGRVVYDDLFFEPTGLHAASRHDLLAGETTWELAFSLDLLGEDYDGELTISVRLFDEASPEKPTAEWKDLTFICHELTSAQEEAATLVADVENRELNPDEAKKLITEAIPQIANTRVGFHAFDKLVKKAEFTPLDRTRAIIRFLHQTRGAHGHGGALMLFRSCLGTPKMNWEKSVAIVERVVPSAGLARAEVYRGQRPHYFNNPNSVVTGWNAIGPFPYEDATARRASRPTQLQKITLQETYDLGGRTLHWQTATADGKGAVDLRTTLESTEDGKAYAVTWVHSPRSEPLAMELHSTTPAIAWVNGIEAPRQPWSGEGVVVQLNEGWNQILIESESVGAKRQRGRGTLEADVWSFQVQLIDDYGLRVPNDLKMHQLR